MLPFVRIFKRKSHFAWDGLKPHSYGKVADKNLRGERMTCSAYLPMMQDDGAYCYSNPIPDQPARPRRRRKPQGNAPREQKAEPAPKQAKPLKEPKEKAPKDQNPETGEEAAQAKKPPRRRPNHRRRKGPKPAGEAE